jgi:hypothetical protein
MTTGDRPTPKDPLPVARPVPRKPTLRGPVVQPASAAPAPRPTAAAAKDDPQSVRAEEAATSREGRLLAQLSDEREEKAELARKLAEAQAPRVEVDPSTTSLRKRRDWYPLVVKVALLLGGLAAAATAYLTARASQLEPKVDAAKAVQVVTAGDIKAAVDRIDKLEEWRAAEVRHRDCIERQVRDAVERVGGHTLMAAPRGGTDWAQQAAPPTKQSVPWARAPWFTTEPCPPAPP